MTMKTPQIVSPQEWEVAREQMLTKEKALTRARDALAGFVLDPNALVQCVRTDTARLDDPCAHLMRPAGDYLNLVRSLAEHLHRFFSTLRCRRKRISHRGPSAAIRRSPTG